MHICRQVVAMNILVGVQHSRIYFFFFLTALPALAEKLFDVFDTL